MTAPVEGWNIAVEQNQFFGLPVPSLSMLFPVNRKSMKLSPASLIICHLKLSLHRKNIKYLKELY